MMSVEILVVNKKKQNKLEKGVTLIHMLRISSVTQRKIKRGALQ
jgi:hypothetical protein